MLMEIFEYIYLDLCLAIDCIDYVTGIGNVIQAPPHSVLRANTFSVGQQTTNSFDTSTVSISVCPRAWLKL